MREWWRDAVIYQIYPRSFQDETGDGIGDLKGITRRLPHVSELGADAIWMSPFFTSPDRDMGYDVSDYCDVSPIYGTLADFDTLVARAHDLGLKVIIDQVLSHTSDEHPWFVESRENRTNPKADWYVWADPQADGTPPNNWLSIFGGSAWMFDPRRRQYYLHNFLTEQPDLNFHNPDVVDALLDVMRFWLDRGVDGFRLDTVNFYVHDTQLQDNPALTPDPFPHNPYEAQDQRHSKTQTENLDVLRRMRALTDQYDGRMMVGEVGESLRSIEVMADYTSGNDKLHMAYSFDFLSHDHSAQHFRSRIETFQQKAPDGWPCWSFSNHDVDRHVSRWTPECGDSDALAKQSIAMLASFPGTLGIFQGEELGQTQTEIKFDELRDTANIAFWPDYKGRDGCRTPMVWESDAPNAGFSSGTPWLPVKSPQAARAVDGQQASNTSVLHSYRSTLAFRKNHTPLTLGSTSFHDLPKPILGLTRVHDGQEITALFNLSAKPHDLTATGDVTQVGPANATVDGQSIHLPAHGFLFLASDNAITVVTKDAEQTAPA